MTGDASLFFGTRHPGTRGVGPGMLLLSLGFPLSFLKSYGCAAGCTTSRYIYIYIALQTSSNKRYDARELLEEFRDGFGKVLVKTPVVVKFVADLCDVCTRPSLP